MENECFSGEGSPAGQRPGVLQPGHAGHGRRRLRLGRGMVQARSPAQAGLPQRPLQPRPPPQRTGRDLDHVMAAFSVSGCRL